MNAKIKSYSLRLTGLVVLATVVLVGANVAVPFRLAGGGAPPDQSLRAQYHFTPPAHWLSDPQRPIYLNGQYNLYYLSSAQDNGKGGWHHATSTDNVVFKDVGTALPLAPNFPVWTGSGVVDTNNTAGFGAGAVVVLATQPTNGDPYQQSQYLWSSTDGGTTFTAYGAPVINNPGGSNWFRDPKIVWDAANNNWVAVIGQSQSLVFYTSANLKNWTYKSTFTYTTPNIGGFECPDIYQIKADDGTWHWVLGASTQGDYSNQPDTFGYWTGTWNGTSFVTDTANPQWLDWGWDWYAAISWPNQANPDSSRFATGWMNNWHYAPRAVTTDPSDGYNGQNSITREIKLVKQPDNSYSLLSTPTAALDNIVTNTITPANVNVNNSTADLAYHGTAYRMDVDVSWTTLNNVGISVGQSADKARGTNVGIFGGNSLYVDRTRSDQPNYSFGAAYQKSQSPIPATTSAHLTIFVDRSSVEVMLGNGKFVHSNLVFFQPGDTGITLYTSGGSATFSNITIKEYQDITNAANRANPYADFEGTTYGSWTTTGTAWGSGPAAGALSGQMPVTGYLGNRLANSFNGGDASTGTLSSPNFTVNKPFINFLIGGGNHPRPSDLFADFEGTTFGSGWTTTGDFVGQGPNASGLPGQVGAKVLDTFVGGGDPATGTITSPSFTITRDYIDFLIAGGNHPWGSSGATAINLIVDGVVQRTATGNNSSTMAQVAWDVHDLNGRTAQIQVVDNNASDVWGHLAVDQILFSSGPGAVAGEPDVQTTVNLVVNGSVVRTATGQNSEQLKWTGWNVTNLSGATASIQIIDNNTGSWGHVLADQITFDDRRAS
jgi:levanbiose-producing levanase